MGRSPSLVWSVRGDVLGGWGGEHPAWRTSGLRPALARRLGTAPVAPTNSRDTRGPAEGWTTPLRHLWEGAEGLRGWLQAVRAEMAHRPRPRPPSRYHSFQALKWGRERSSVWGVGWHGAAQEEEAETAATPHPSADSGAEDLTPLVPPPGKAPVLPWGPPQLPRALVSAWPHGPRARFPSCTVSSLAWTVTAS